jgi:AraC-like DNA-binding protein
LRVSVLVHLPEVLRELGANSDALVTEAGVDPLLLRDPENTIAFRTVGRLLEHCARRTGCSHLGLLVGQKSKVTALGVVGLLGQHSPDVGTALHNLIKHLHLHDRGGVASLERSGEFAHLAYGIYEHDVPGRDQIYAGSMAHIYNLMRGLCGAAWSPTEVLFPFRKPHNPEPFQRCFHAPLRFDAEHCALFFRATWLSHPLAAADPRVREALEALVGRLEGRSAGSIVPSVQRSLRTMLMRGQFSEAGIAQAFAVHRRTLNRRLEVEGTTFRRLLDDARFEVARQLLRDSDAAIDQIAGCLGYSGSTAFGRAFRRWSGLAPQAWRTGAADRSSTST